jgi:16S rRNA (cytosine967-C5)-methyltransferase
VAISPAREAAYRILRQVEAGRKFAAELLQAAPVSLLRDADRHLATELVMGVLRWRGELDYWIAEISSKPLKYFDPEVLTILRLGIYQIRFLERIPKSAAVHEAVELTKLVRKRSATGLVNAVLRKCEPPARHVGRGLSDGADAAMRDALRRSFPAWLRERWEEHYGSEGAISLARASNSVPLTCLRVCGGSEEAVQARLEREGVRTRPGRFASRALVVHAGNVPSSAAFREKLVVIQDEASQLVADLVAPQPGERVLDLCAAPGIKTGQLAAALGEGLLVACDLSPRRLRLMPTLLRPPLPEAVRFARVRLDATRDLPFACTFDRILVDAPCSGTGTLARNPEIKWRLQPQDLSRLAERQEKMLRNALQILAPGGRLVYATCSLEPEENEQVVQDVLQETRGFRLLTARELSLDFPTLAPLFDSHGFLHTRPDLHGTEGFFAACVVRIA